MRMQGTLALAAVAAGALISAAPALGAGAIQGSTGLPDLDVRTGKIAPTAATRFVRVAELQAFGAASRVQ